MTETQWDGFHERRITIHVHNLFERDRQNTEGGGLAACVQSLHTCSEIRPSELGRGVENIWVRISRKTKGVDFYFRPPAHPRRSGRIFPKANKRFPQRGMKRLGTLIMLTSVGRQTAERSHSKKFPTSPNDHFLLQSGKKSLSIARGEEGALLALLFSPEHPPTGEGRDPLSPLPTVRVSL